MNCWHFMKCPPAIQKTCPAYPDNGLDCWKVTGTNCDQGRMEMASLQEKVIHCRTCPFYQQFAHKY